MATNFIGYLLKEIIDKDILSAPSVWKFPKHLHGQINSFDKAGLQ